MSYNGSGTFLINSAGQPVVANTVISATVFNALTSDLATGLSTAITKDGQTTITNNIPFGSNKITGLGSGTAAADAANLGQVQSTVAKLITVTGTDTITGSMSPQLTAYAAGQLFYFVANAANTSAVTLNIDSLGAKSITRDGSSALAAGDINSGEVVVVIYDGTRFQMINAANSFGNTTINGTLAVTGNAGFQANVSITSALSVGGVFAVTGAATFTANPTLSGGTANGVLYLNGSKVTTSGSALYFDGTGKLGVGTTTPVSGVSAGFEAVGEIWATTASSNSNQIRLSPATSGANIIYSTYSGSGSYLPLAFNVSGSEGMRLTSTGLGIGTASPAAKLDVYQSSLRYVRTYPSSGLADFEILTNNNSQPAFAVKGTGTADLIRAYSGATQALTLDASGNLGIGTTSPTSLGSGYQSITTNGTNGSGFVIKINGTDASYIYQNSTALQLVNTQATPIYFFTSNTERGRFTSGGYFKASNDGTYVGSTSNYHEFRSTNNSYAVYITNTNASPLGTVIEYNNASPNGTGNVFLFCGDSTATRATIRSNGGLANYQSNNVDLSDARTKKDITPAASMWDKVAALEIVTYKYNDQTHDDVNLGVIAQQVEAVEPVWVDADGFGETPEDGVPLKTVYTKDITFAAIKALQEAMARIEQLEAKVAAMESK